MDITDRTFPDALAALSGIVFPYGDDEGSIDYEPYPEFESAADTAAWVRAWTGNEELDGAEFRVFAQDGSGGLVASWLIRPDQPLAAQPVAFFGSEGEIGVVAASLGEFLWLLAGGVGPQEAVEFGADSGVAQEELRAVAEKYSGIDPRPPAEVLAAARAEFPDFAATVASWCR